MPDRPGLDDDPALARLIALWVDGQADIDARLAQVHANITASLSSGNGIRTRRLRLQVDRLEELRDVTVHLVDDLTLSTHRFISEGRLSLIYAAGAQAGDVGLPFSFTAPHRAAVQVLADDLYGDVLTATAYIDRSSKEWVREVGRQITGFKLTSGTPVKTQARRLERDLARQFQRRGMASVIYRDGSRHGFGEYASMLLRTKTGIAYNQGTLNQGTLAGIQFYELLDGTDCGLVEHHDPDLANGLIVPADVAQAFPLSHPNCRRAINPRPDVTASTMKSAPSVQSPAARADQAAFERSLRAENLGRQSRSRRPGRPGRPQRPTRGARTAQNGSTGLSQQLRRVEALNKREENIAAARRHAEKARIERERFAGTGKVDPELLRRFQVTEDQWLNAAALTPDIKRDIRAVARNEADNLGRWLEDNDLSVMTRPTKLRQTVDAAGRRRHVRTQSGYDFLEQLDDATSRRVRNRMIDSDLYPPDVLAEQVRRKTNLDLSDDEAMDWLVDRWLHEDALRSVASGRVPAYADAANLIPSSYEMEGYDLARLFPDSSGAKARRLKPGEKPPTAAAKRQAKREAKERHAAALDEATGHVAQVQAEAAQRYAARALPEPRYGQAPWQMDAGDFVRELESVEDILASTAIEPGVDPGDLYRWAQARIKELAPIDIDIDGSMNSYELFESIRMTALTAGYPLP